MSRSISEPEAPVCPLPGAIVTYVGLTAIGSSPFQRAVATGNMIVDPDTQQGWLPMVRPDSAVFLLDPAALLDITPWGARRS